MLSYYLSKDILNWLFSVDSYCTILLILLFCLVFVLPRSASVSFIKHTSWWPCCWCVVCFVIIFGSKVTDERFRYCLGIGWMCFGFRWATPCYGRLWSQPVLLSSRWVAVLYWEANHLEFLTRLSLMQMLKLQLYVCVHYMLSYRGDRALSVV